MLKRCLSHRRWIFIVAIVVVCSVVVGKRVYLWRQLAFARQALAAGRSEIAIPVLRRAVAFVPNNAEAHYRLAVAERRSGQFDQFSTALRRAAQLGWAKADLDRQSLLAVVQSGEFEAVEPTLKALMTSGVSDEAAEEIYEATAIGYLSTYRLNEAWICLNSWSQWQPQAAFPKFWRADICRRTKNLAREEQEYRSLLAVDPEHCLARGRLADVLKETGRVQEAKQEYEQCLKQCETRPALLIGLAECHRWLTDSESAVAFLRQANELALTPSERASVLHLWSQIESEQGKLADAIEKLKVASTLAPCEAPILYSLSQLYAHTGQVQLSQAFADRYLLIQSQNARAEKLTQQLLNAPNDADLRYELGMIMIGLGMKPEGAGWLRAALRLNPHHASAQSAIDSVETELNRGLQTNRTTE